MKKTVRIKPPTKPKGESAKITIANQDRQIRLLTDRVVELASSRDEEANIAIQYRIELDSARQELDVMRTHLAQAKMAQKDLAEQVSYNNGYIARVKEADSQFQSLP